MEGNYYLKRIRGWAGEGYMGMGWLLDLVLGLIKLRGPVGLLKFKHKDQFVITPKFRDLM